MSAVPNMNEQLYLMKFGFWLMRVGWRPEPE